MIEKTEEKHWNIRDEDDCPIAYVSLSNGNISFGQNGLDTLEDFKEFHQALGEAIEEAEK